MSNLSLEYKGRTTHSRYPGSQNFIRQAIPWGSALSKWEGGEKKSRMRKMGSRKPKAMRPAVRFQQAGGLGQQSLIRWKTESLEGDLDNWWTEGLILAANTQKTKKTTKTTHTNFRENKISRSPIIPFSTAVNSIPVVINTKYPTSKVHLLWAFVCAAKAEGWMKTRNAASPVKWRDDVWDREGRGVSEQVRHGWERWHQKRVSWNMSQLKWGRWT